MIPARILDVFAAVTLVVAVVSAARLVAGRPWRSWRSWRSWRRTVRPAALADIDVAHLLMGIAMAGQLTSGLRTLPDGAWEAVFGVLTAWFAYRVARDFLVSGIRALAGGHCAPHLVHAGAMLYMFAAVTATHGAGGMGGGMSGMGTLSLPVLAFLFALMLVGYAVWDLDQLSGPGTSGHYSLAAAGISAAGISMAEVPPASGPADGTGVLAPWVATGCRIAMGATMAFMLLIMI